MLRQHLWKRKMLSKKDRTNTCGCTTAAAAAARKRRIYHSSIYE